MDKIFYFLFNKDTISAWIGVIGTFVGTIIAGVISASIAIWTYRKQNNIYSNQLIQNREKGIDMIDEFVDLAISSILFITLGIDGSEGLLNKMLVELKKLKNANFELSNIPGELISIDINVSFQSVRSLLKILEIEIEKALTQQYEDEHKLSIELKGIDIERRLLKIDKYLKDFSKKPHLFLDKNLDKIKPSESK